MNIQRGLGILVGCLFACTAYESSADFVLTGPQGQAAIALPENAEESSVWAAEMLQRYVEKITGEKLVIRIGGDGVPSPSADVDGRRLNAAPTVVIGTLKTLGDAVPADIVAKLKGAKQYEASFTRVTDDTIWIVAKESLGEHYAVNHFLETRCGVTWFTVASSRRFIWTGSSSSVSRSRCAFCRVKGRSRSRSRRSRHCIFRSCLARPPTRSRIYSSNWE